MVYKFYNDLDLLDTEDNSICVGFFEDACRELGADGYDFPGDDCDVLKEVSKAKAAARLKPLVFGMFAFAEKHYCEKTSMEFRIVRDCYGIGTPKLSTRQIAKKYNLAEWVVRDIIRNRISAMRRGIFSPWGYLFIVATHLPDEEYKTFLDIMRENRAIIRKECKNAIPILKCIDAKLPGH